MRIIDIPGTRIHILVWYLDRAVRFQFDPGRGAHEHRVRRLRRLTKVALREAHEALQIPAGVLPKREDGDAILTVGIDPLPLPDGVREVWL